MSGGFELHEPAPRRAKFRGLVPDRRMLIILCYITLTAKGRGKREVFCFRIVVGPSPFTSSSLACNNSIKHKSIINIMFRIFSYPKPNMLVQRRFAGGDSRSDVCRGLLSMIPIPATQTAPGVDSRTRALAAVVVAPRDSDGSSVGWPILSTCILLLTQSSFFFGRSAIIILRTSFCRLV